MFALLHDYQQSDSKLTLSGLIRSGFAALRSAYQLRGDPDTMIRGISEALGLSPTDGGALDAWWRTEAARASSAPRQNDGLRQ